MKKVKLVDHLDISMQVRCREADNAGCRRDTTCSARCLCSSEGSFNENQMDDRMLTTKNIGAYMSELTAEISAFLRR